MHKGQRIRLRRMSPLAQQWEIPLSAEGTVICQYRLFVGWPDALDRVDVRFSAGTVLWGVPAREFEVVANGPQKGDSGGA